MKMDNKERISIEDMLNEAETAKSVDIREGTFFLPDDCEKFKGRGRWALFVKEGRLIRIEEKKEEGSKKNIQ